MKTLNIILSKSSGADVEAIKDQYDPKRVQRREKAAALAETPEGLDAINRKQEMNAQIMSIKASDLAVTSAVGLSVQFGKSMLRYGMSGIQYDTGDSSYAAQVNEIYSDTMAWVGYGSSIMSGAMMGAAVGGPVGALIGGGTAALGGAMNMEFRNAEETRRLNYQIWQDTVQVDYNKARAKVNVYGGGRLR